jgi:hypothetical protein
MRGSRLRPIVGGEADPAGGDPAGDNPAGGDPAGGGGASKSNVAKSALLLRRRKRRSGDTLFETLGVRFGGRRGARGEPETASVVAAALLRGVWRRRRCAAKVKACCTPRTQKVTSTSPSP